MVGGTTGIGFAVADALSDTGAEVIIGSSSQAKLKLALKALPTGVKGFVVDVGSEDSIQKFFDQTGEFDHLTSTVGPSYQLKPVVETTLADVENLRRIKFWGQFFIAKYGAERIQERGSLTLTSGVLSHQAVPGLAVLAAINSGLEALGRTLALELAPKRVNVVCPGFIDTGKSLSQLAPAQRTAKLQQNADTIPTKHIGLPQDAAKSYLYAMENPYVTGQTLIVDGGSSLV